jgi:8-hydroxy-5-deazaflavin:NADPH oxidoreductase
VRRAIDPQQREQGLPINVKSVAVVGGTGKLGFALTLRMARAGLSVLVGSRDERRAEAAAERAAAHKLPGKIVGTNSPHAVHIADVVVLAVPFAAQLPTLKTMRGAWRPGQVAIETCVPLATVLGGKPTHLVQVWHGSAAEQARDAIPQGVAVVSAFHTVSAERLGNSAETLDEDVLVCGDRPEATALVCSIIDRLGGLRAVYCGPLELSRLTEAITPLLIAINKTRSAPSGIRITAAQAAAPSFAGAHDGFAPPSAAGA